MTVGLLGGEEGRDDFDEDFLEVLLGIFIAEFGECTFDKELARLDDTDGVAELLDFGHDMRGENDGFAPVAAFTDKLDDRARGHNVEATGRLVEDHDGRVVDEGACDGSLLLHAGGELVAAAVAEAVHIQTVEDAVDALFQRGFV